MQDTRYLVQVVRESLLERVNDFGEPSLCLTRTSQNKLQLANQICQRENARAALLTRITSYLYEHLKKESGDALTDATKYLPLLIRSVYSMVLAIFRGMTPKFQPERCLSRGDYRSIIELLRQYFLFVNNIKMLWRVEEMSKNKTLKKSTVLAMAVRHLLDCTKEHHQERAKSLNQSITCEDIQEFNSMMIARQQREPTRQGAHESGNRTCLGFYASDKVAVKNLADNVELRFGSEEKHDGGWRLDIAEVKRHRTRLLSRGRGSNHDAMTHTSSQFHNASKLTLSSMQSTAITRNDHGRILNDCLTKTTPNRPSSDMANHHSLHIDDKETPREPDQIVDSLPKPITETQLRPKLLLRSMLQARAPRKASSVIKQPTSKQQKQELLSRMYGVLDVDSDIISRMADLNSTSTKMMEANSRLRNKWIQRSRMEQETLIRLKKQRK